VVWSFDRQAGGAIAARYGRLATLALLFVTATYGSTFFLIKDLLARVPVLDFLAIRFAIAAAVLFALAPRTVFALDVRDRWRGAALGLVYGIAQILQTTGLGHTSASVSGFITGMYVVCTPILAGLLLRQRVSAIAWVAVGVATAGLGVLSLQGFSVGYGEALTFAAAVLYAGHIVGLGAWSTPERAYGLAVLQMAVIALVCGAVTLPDGVVMPGTAADWLSIVYMALVAGALALLLQTWAQAHLAPTRAAIVMTMEPVFAALFAVLLGGEALTLRMVIGGALVVAAMLLVETGPRRKVEGEVPHLAV
jgi:drug/metabolite transporter (DMT)-like permease